MVMRGEAGFGCSRSGNDVDAFVLPRWCLSLLHCVWCFYCVLGQLLGPQDCLCSMTLGGTIMMVFIFTKIIN
jgi:hypothetical protein